MTIVFSLPLKIIFKKMLHLWLDNMFRALYHSCRVLRWLYLFTFLIFMLVLDYHQAHQNHTHLLVGSVMVTCIPSLIFIHTTHTFSYTCWYISKRNSKNDTLLYLEEWETRVKVAKDHLQELETIAQNQGLALTDRNRLAEAYRYNREVLHGILNKIIWVDQLLCVCVMIYILIHLLCASASYSFTLLFTWIIYLWCRWLTFWSSEEVTVESHRAKKT